MESFIKDNITTINTTLHFVFLDYKIKNIYDRILISESNKDTHKIIKIENNILIMSFNIDSFSMNIECTFLSSFTSNKSPKYKIIIYSLHTNYIYAFINNNEFYQVDIYSQLNPPDKIATLFSPIIINEKKKQYVLPLNLIDYIRGKSVITICNISISFIIEKPNVKFHVTKEDLNHSNYLKICLYYLFNNSSKQIEYKITCHSICIEQNDLSTFIEHANNKESIGSKYKDICISAITHMQTLLNKYITIQKEEMYLEFFKEIDLICSQHFEKTDLFTICQIPIEKIENIDDDTYYVLHTTYLIQLIKEVKDIWNNNRSLSSTIYLYNKIYSCWQLIHLEIKKISDNNSLRENIRHLSLVTGNLELQVSASEEELQVPQVINVDTLNEKNFYFKGINLLRSVITNLNNSSFLVEPLSLLNSNISKNINKTHDVKTFLNLFKSKKNEKVYDNGENVFEINIIDYNKIKDELMKIFPNKIYRFYSQYPCNAEFQPRSNMISINEFYLLEEKQGYLNKIFEDNKDPQGKFSIQVFMELLHEFLGHCKIEIGKLLVSTPTKFLYNGEIKENKTSPDAGCIIEQFLSSKKENIYFLKDPYTNCSSLYNVSFFTDENNIRLNNMIEDLQSINKQAHIARQNLIIQKEQRGFSKKDFIKNKKKMKIKFNSTIFNRLTVGKVC